MQEFFEKISGFVNGIDFFILRWLIKLIFFILTIVIIIFFVLLFYSNKGYIVLIFLGMYILAEIFHFYRRFREKIMAKRMMKIEQKNAIVKKK